MYRVGVPRRRSRVLQSAATGAILVFVSACSSSNEAAIITTTTETPAIATETPDAAEFCIVGARVMLDQNTATLNDFSPQYFDRVDEELALLLSNAPVELGDSVSALRSGFSTTADIFEEFGFNAGASGFVEALAERLDNDSMIDAAEAINGYLDNRCDASDLVAGRAPGGYSFDRSDPVNGPLNVQTLSPEMPPETAQCIYDAWGDITKIPPEELTQELWIFPICGTSIFELLTGDGRLTGALTTDE